MMLRLPFNEYPFILNVADLSRGLSNLSLSSVVGAIAPVMLLQSDRVQMLFVVYLVVGH